MAGPAIFGGSRTKIITSKGLLLKDGTPIDFNGPKNYVTRGTFSTNDTTGWSLKRTTLSGLIPNQVAASWTTPSVLTLSATTTGALTNSGYSLSLAASAATTAGDMLVSDAYTIDIEDQAKVLNFKFSYKAYANASNMNFSGTSSNTLHVYIYDVTNNAWIQPSGCYTMVQNSGVGIGYGTFQTPSNMTQFRIAIVSCNTSSGAFTMYFDNVFVGPQQFNMGPPVTDWVSYTPSLKGTGSDPNLGSTATKQGFWRRVGDSIQLKIFVEASGTGITNGSGDYYFTLPSGLSIDVNKAGSIVGNGYYYNAGTAAAGTISIVLSSGIGLFADGGLIVAQNVPSANWLSAGDNLRIDATVPISGWSSNTVMSSDAATNVVDLFAYRTTSSSALTSGVDTLISFPTVAKDSNSSFNASFDTYTVPVAGDYRVNCSITFNAGTLTTQVQQKVYVNGNPYILPSVLPVTTTGLITCTSAPIIPNLKAGDTIKIYAWISGGTATIIYSDSNKLTSLSIERISGPAQIAASSVVAASITPSAQTWPNGTQQIVSYTSKTLDTTNSFDVSTKKYTVPISGIYEISARLNIDYSATVSCPGNIMIYKNGGQVTTSPTSDMSYLYKNGSFGTFAPSYRVSTQVTLFAGDIVWIEVVAFGSASTGNVTMNTYNGELDIKRLGGVM